MGKIKLLNAVEMFKQQAIIEKQIPTEDEISKLTNDNHVKICAGRERFWCKVIKIDVSQKIIICQVDNDLDFSDEHGYYYNDKITILFCNVLNII